MTRLLKSETTTILLCLTTSRRRRDRQTNSMRPKLSMTSTIWRRQLIRWLVLLLLPSKDLRYSSTSLWDLSSPPPSSLSSWSSCAARLISGLSRTSLEGCLLDWDGGAKSIKKEKKFGGLRVLPSSEMQTKLTTPSSGPVRSWQPQFGQYCWSSRSWLSVLSGYKMIYVRACFSLSASPCVEPTFTPTISAEEVVLLRF